MANFFDQFDMADVGTTPDGRPSITVRPDRGGYDKAISAIESGGRYDIVGPATRDGDRAFGKYQVMGKNIAPWTKEHLGQELTPQQFLASPEAQDAVFNGKFGGYVKKYGAEGAARAWFAGEGGMNDPSRRDVLGTSVADYSRKFTSAMGQPQPAQPQQQSPQPQQKTANFFDQFDNATPQPGAVESRFGEMQPPESGAPALREGLNQHALDMTRGPAASPAAQMAVGHENALAAAAQRTSPDISQYGGRVVSTETFQDDGGGILYRDPQTKELKPTNNATQVVIRDPADGVVKVFDRSEATNESALSGVARVATQGMTAGAPTARAALPAAGNIVPKASDIFSTAKPFYRAFKNEAGKIEIPVETAQGMADQIRRSLTGANLIPELAQPVYSAIAIMEKGEPLTLDALQNVKRVVGRSFNSPDKNMRDAAAVASGEITKIIGQVSKEAGQNLKTADAIHSTARSVQDLQRKGDVADLRAGRAGYGGNAVNSMRQVLSPIVQRAVEGKTTGFKPNEIQAMRDIVEGTTATNAARAIGQLSPAKGIMQTAAGAGAIATMGPAAIAIPALGIASNKLATIMTGKQIDHLREVVAKRSPAYAQAVKKAAERFEQAQIEFANNPAPNKFAAYISASRALSAGLTRDGVQITSGDLLKSIRGPMQSAADDQQDPVPRVPGQ